MKNMSNKQKTITILILAILFFMALYLATFAGYNDNGINLLKKSFCLSDDSDSILLEVLRFPRVLKAVISGSCLALSGMLMQSVSKNPLAEPYITGISSGAGLGIVISVLLFGGVNYAAFGFAGAVVSALFVILVCGFGRFSISKLILIGLSVNMFASSIVSFLILKNPERTYSLMYILTGNITDNTGISDKSLFLIFIFALVITVLYIPKLNFLRLDSEILFNQKKNKTFYDIITLIISSFYAAMSVLTAGILSFVGIIAPQISKMIVGCDYRWVFFTNILIGSVFVLIADYISRIILYPVQIPLGLVIAFIGSPVFVYFLLKKGGLSND